MQIYMYKQSFYCEDCATKLNTILLEQEKLFNIKSDCFPVSVTYQKDSWPIHCSSGKNCVNPIKLHSGTAIGAFLENSLTYNGFNELKEKLHKYDKSVQKLLGDFYGIDYEVKKPTNISLEYCIRIKLDDKTDWNTDIANAMPEGFEVVPLLSGEFDTKDCFGRHVIMIRPINHTVNTLKHIQMIEEKLLKIKDIVND